MAYSGEHHSDKSQPQIWPPTQAKKCHFHLLNHASSQSVAWSISIFGWFSQPTENMQLQIIIPHYHKDIARTTKTLKPPSKCEFHLGVSENWGNCLHNCHVWQSGWKKWWWTILSEMYHLYFWRMCSSSPILSHEISHYNISFYPIKIPLYPIHG